MRPWIQSEFALFAIGKTGRGKTVFGNAVHAASDRLSVFWNAQDKGYVRGKRVQYRGSADHQKLASAVRGGAERLNVVPTEDSPEVLSDLVDWLWHLASNGVRIHVVVDESHDYAPTGSKGTPVHRLAKRGRSPGSGDGGIKTTLLSQRFVALERGARTEAEYLAVVGIPDGEDWDQLEKKARIDLEELEQRHSQEKFLFTVDGGETVSRAFSVYQNGERIAGPSIVASKYAD